MTLGLDPEIATAPAPMAGAMAEATPSAVGDVEARRALREPIIGAAGTAQPIPADVTTTDHHATADDGTRITMRWDAKEGAAPGTCPRAACRCSPSSTDARPNTPSPPRSRTPARHCGGCTNTPPSWASTPPGSA